MPKISNLKPCPFCDWLKSYTESELAEVWIECAYCGGPHSYEVHTDKEKAIEEAMKLWNNRGKR